VSGLETPLRLAVLADIHGNLPALNAVIDDLRREWGEIEGIVVAGDFTGGPRPRETAARLRELGCWMIRGNNEDYVLSYADRTAPEIWWTSLQWASSRWSYRQLDEAAIDLVRSLPRQRVIDLPRAASVRVVHGSTERVDESILPDRNADRLAELLSQTEEAVVVCGHTHIPWMRSIAGVLALNPGSVGLPCDGDCRAHYAVLTWKGEGLTWKSGLWQAEHRVAPYDPECLRAAYDDSGFLEEGGGFARALLMTAETGRDVGIALMAHVRDVVSQTRGERIDAVSDETWEQAMATFPWERWK